MMTKEYAKSADICSLKKADILLNRTERQPKILFFCVQNWAKLDYIFLDVWVIFKKVIF